MKRRLASRPSPPFDAETLVKSFQMYRMTIRNSVRAFWGGTWNWYEFWDSMATAIYNQFPVAWREGMRLAGMEPDDMTQEERIRLQQEITHETSYITGFADAIERGSKANGGKLEPLFKRADLWAAGYNRIRDLAMTYARNDPKLEWVMGPTREHCVSCIRLSGKVKRASVWRAADLAPRMWKLACRGVHCLCELVPTDKPASRGPLPVI